MFAYQWINCIYAQLGLTGLSLHSKLVNYLTFAYKYQSFAQEILVEFF